MIVMIDNYDSFTYNLVQYLQMLGRDVRVVRNDAVDVATVLGWRPEAIVISPGPGRPEAAGISVPLIRAGAPRIPILGVCLGHQAIGIAFGARVGKAKHLMHGKTSSVRGDGRAIYQGIQAPFPAMRYHSLAIQGDSLPECLEITATADDGEVMGVRHRRYPTEGIQFHPESIMTPVGKRLLRNFLNQNGSAQAAAA